MNYILILSIIYFLSLSVVLFDLDYTRAKKIGNISKDEPATPQWIGSIYLVCIVTWIAILFMNWKISVLGVVVYYSSSVIPLPQTVGNILLSPFKSRGKL
jgi:hypothetical protein